MMSITICGDYIPVRALETETTPGLRVANLECAFADGAVSTGKAYTSVLPFERTNDENIGRFAALSVANNHVYDAGDFATQLKRLEEKFPRVQFFGTAAKSFAKFDLDGRKVRSRGELIFKEEEVLPLLKKLRGEFDRLYVYPHWGKESEYTRYPSPRQIRLAHRWIDAGADGIFGSHSHVFQGCETYRGTPVFYSLGNFCFPHPESALYAGTDTGMIVSLDIVSEKTETSFHRFDQDGNIAAADQEKCIALSREISQNLDNWSYGKWGRRIGGLYIRKNMASWKLRLWKKFPINFIKFLVWNFMPLTIWMRVCSWCSHNKTIEK